MALHFCIFAFLHLALLSFSPFVFVFLFLIFTTTFLFLSRNLIHLLPCCLLYCPFALLRYLLFLIGFGLGKRYFISKFFLVALILTNNGLLRGCTRGGNRSHKNYSCASVFSVLLGPPGNV